MAEKRVDEKRLNDIKRKSSHGGPGAGFGGIQEKPQDTKGTIKRLLKVIFSFKKLIIPLIISVLIHTAASLAISIALKDLIKSLGVYNLETLQWDVAPDRGSFVNLFLIISIIYLTIVITQFINGWIASFLAHHLSIKVRDDLFKKVVYLPIRYTDRHSAGDIMSRITNDIDSIINSVTSTITSLISGILTVAGCLIIMIYFSPLLTLVALITLALSIILTFLMGKYMRPLFTKQQTILGQLNSQTEEMVSGLKTVLAYNHQKVAEDDFNRYSENYTKVGLTAQIIGGSMGPLHNFISNLNYFLVTFFGALFIINGYGKTLFGDPIGVETIIAFLYMTKEFTRPINEIAQLYTTLISALAGAERVFTLMDAKEEDLDEKLVDYDMKEIQGNVSFNNVYFAYNEEKKVINGFSVDVYKGHKIALVGATGSGKTTMVNLLMRFYDINDGSITIDGIDISKMSKSDIRHSISIVLQDAVLFNDTVFNNVKYSKPDATYEEVMNALKLANCDSFVSKLPEQENTILTEGATNISAGQRQLLTIARAILADPKILILDEATSSVDTRTEKKIQDALVNLMKNRTSIIIAHRLSTIQDADLIVVMDKGCVVEMGNHKQLISLNGVYNSLYQTQFSGLNT